MSDLKIDYKDDVLNTEVNERRKYQMIQNDDGTVSFVDVTDYSQVGDSFGALDINATNKKLNEVNNSLSDLNSNLDTTNTGLNNANKAIESNHKAIIELSKTTTGSVSYTTYIDGTNSVVNLKKKNNQVNLGISCKLKSGMGLGGQSWTPIFTLQEGFRPKDGEYGSGCSLNGITCGVNIATDGSVAVNPSKDMTGDFEVIYARLSFYTD